MVDKLVLWPTQELVSVLLQALTHKETFQY